MSNSLEALLARFQGWSAWSTPIDHNNLAPAMKHTYAPSPMLMWEVQDFNRGTAINQLPLLRQVAGDDVYERPILMERPHQ